MLVDGFIIGILVAKFRGGKFNELLNVNLRSIWLIVLAFVIQYAIILLNSTLLFPAVMISYGLLLFFCFLNRKQPGFYLVLLGVAMNFLVMVTNQGRMPVDAEVIKQFAPEDLPGLLTGQVGKHVAMSDQTHFNFLGDIFFLHAPYPYSALVSLGDIVFSLGVFLFIQKIMVKRRSPNKGSVIQDV